MRALISVVVLAVVIALSYHEVKPQGTTSYGGFDLVDKTGNIRKPNGYRDHYQILGTFTVFNAIPMVRWRSSEKGGESHYTYASPGTAEYYRKTGKFPDGAVLVKEVFGTDHGTYDDRGGALGLGNESVVRYDQRRKRTLSRQSALG